MTSNLTRSFIRSRKFIRFLSTSAVNATNNKKDVSFQHINLTYPAPFVAHVELNRPEKRNALNDKLWTEIGECFNFLARDENCRSIVLSGAGKAFCAGIDLMHLMGVMQSIMGGDLDVARKAFQLKTLIRKYQDVFTAIEKCPKPVIASVHGLCIGGAMAMLTATDIRYSTSDASFQIKEVELGLAGDVGHLQRLPKILGNESLYRELCLSARMFNAEEALKIGLVSSLFPNKEELMKGSLSMAALIASKSPVAVQGTKVQLNYARDHDVDDSLEYMATWNMAMLQSEDLLKAAAAVASKQSEPVDFNKL